MKKARFVPITPAGTVLYHLAADREGVAWEKLIREAFYMPYKGIEEFKKRGYTVVNMEVKDRGDD